MAHLKFEFEATQPPSSTPPRSTRLVIDLNKYNLDQSRSYRRQCHREEFGSQGSQMSTTNPPTAQVFAFWKGDASEALRSIGDSVISFRKQYAIKETTHKACASRTQQSKHGRIICFLYTTICRFSVRGVQRSFGRERRGCGREPREIH